MHHPINSSQAQAAFTNQLVLYCIFFVLDFPLPRRCLTAVGWAYSTYGVRNIYQVFRQIPFWAIDSKLNFLGSLLTTHYLESSVQLIIMLLEHVTGFVSLFIAPQSYCTERLFACSWTALCQSKTYPVSLRVQSVLPMLRLTAQEVLTLHSNILFSLHIFFLSHYALLQVISTSFGIRYFNHFGQFHYFVGFCQRFSTICVLIYL